MTIVDRCNDPNEREDKVTKTSANRPMTICSIAAVRMILRASTPRGAIKLYANVDRACVNHVFRVRPNKLQVNGIARFLSHEFQLLRSADRNFTDNNGKITFASTRTCPSLVAVAKSR